MNNQYFVQWASPSNIALIKYWGKYGDQLPLNPSISFSLKQAVSTMSIALEKTKKPSMDFFFEGKENLKFKEKIQDYLKRLESFFPWMLNYHLEIKSSNTFPHSSGIASSASSMSALALCLLSVDEYLTNKKYDLENFYKLASKLSRLGSGSAARSLYPGLVSWGESSEILNSSNEYATQFTSAHPIFKDYCDSILIVDDNQKSISSRAGHRLMEDHPFKDARIKIAKENFDHLLKALKQGDLELFIKIVEQEALTLHALMMTSNPSYILLKPDSLSLIEEIKAFRFTKNIPICFTIDAGPNIHLLYPKSYETIIHPWIETELFSKGIVKKWIHDEVGDGPKEID